MMIKENQTQEQILHYPLGIQFEHKHLARLNKAYGNSTAYYPWPEEIWRSCENFTKTRCKEREVMEDNT